MKNNILDINEPKERSSLGISDKGSIVATCSKCMKNLMVFQLTKTNEELVKELKSPITTKIAILCEKCKHINSVFSIRGQFYPGSIDDQTKFEIDENIIHGDGVTPDADVVFKVKG